MLNILKQGATTGFFYFNRPGWNVSSPARDGRSHRESGDRCVFWGMMNWTPVSFVEAEAVRYNSWKLVLKKGLQVPPAQSEVACLFCVAPRSSA